LDKQIHLPEKNGRALEGYETRQNLRDLYISYRSEVASNAAFARRQKCLSQQPELLSQTQSFDNLAVPIGITTIQIIQQTPAPVHHHDQTPA